MGAPEVKLTLCIFCDCLNKCHYKYATGDEKPRECDIYKHIVATKWRELGLALGLTSSQLDIINVDHPNSCEQRCKVIQKWLKQDPLATWGKLVDAMQFCAVSSCITKGGKLYLNY